MTAVKAQTLTFFFHRSPPTTPDYNARVDFPTCMHQITTQEMLSITVVELYDYYDYSHN